MKDNNIVILDNKEVIVKQHKQDIWLFIDANSNYVMEVITKDDIIEYCKRELRDTDISTMCADILIENVWYYIQQELCRDNMTLQGFSKFSTWFDYVCVECFSNELVSHYYKNRLL